MHSDVVYEHKNLFNELLCRQITWAIIEESRAYFAQRMSLDDFAIMHPDDIIFPRCTLILLDNHIRTQTPIQRSSFPAAWMPGGRTTVANNNPGSRNSIPPVPQVAATRGATPTVASALTTGTRTATRTPVQIRPDNIHPKIKSLMEPYIQKFQGVLLTPLLAQVNLTLDDLPKLGPEVGGTNGICYNFILGWCTLDSCRHKDGHVNVRDVTDEFATKITTKLRPGVTQFLANGIPDNLPRRGQRRQRE